jgi:hypothetical protein
VDDEVRELICVVGSTPFSDPVPGGTDVIRLADQSPDEEILMVTAVALRPERWS